MIGDPMLTRGEEERVKWVRYAELLRQALFANGLEVPARNPGSKDDNAVFRACRSMRSRHPIDLSGRPSTGRARGAPVPADLLA